MFNPKTLREYFRPGEGAGRFFATMAIWGVAVGCFQSVMNNFLANMAQVGPAQRGYLEFWREMPGLLLVFIIAMMHRYSDWKIMRIGTFVAMLGILGLLWSTAIFPVMVFMVLWSVGEHILLPVRSTIAMTVAKPKQEGRSLGLMSGLFNAGNVTGCVIAAGVFLVGSRILGAVERIELYNIIWAFILVLMILVLGVLGRFKPHGYVHKQRPRLYFRRKYTKFYILELFYGARKQVFMTFAPFVMVIIYKFEPHEMAILVGLCALVNSFCGPLIGWLTDKFGYKNIMIYDTVILAFVCLAYGFAGILFPPSVAWIVVSVNFILDAVISTTAMATSLYVKDISDSKEEVSASITTGISVNHFISVFAGLLGGWVWHRFGVETLFIAAAVFAVCNSLFALTLPRPKHHLHPAPDDLPAPLD